MTPEIFFNCLISHKAEDSYNFTESLKEAVKCCFVEKFTDGEERPCQDSDYTDKKKSSEIHITFLKKILQHILEDSYYSEKICSQNQGINIDNELLALILIICGENVHLKPWNTRTSVENCADILSVLLTIFDCDSTISLISKGSKKKLIESMLHILQPKLLKATWKLFPASIDCYTWILEKIKQPEMSTLVSITLPTALLLVDDFVNENRITGIHCLQHIIENITIAELQFHNHGDVIYNALKPLIRIREVNIISSVVPCLTSLTIKLEKDFGEKDVTKWSKFDEILEIYLEYMELEQLIDLRSCYMENLDYLISASSIGIIRWSKRLLKIFKEYLQEQENFFDGKMTYWCLKELENYLKVSKSVLHLYGKNIVFILFTVFYNMKNNQECSMQEEINIVIKRLVYLLQDSMLESYLRKTNKKLQDTYGIDFDFIKFYEYMSSN